ncbi:MAG: hypothetical protein ABSD81_03850 [Methanomicrobiales archaeon]
MAITTFESLLDLKTVFPRISRNDKIPDIDGCLVLCDINKVPIAKLEVQIKKLPDGNSDDPKIPCPLSIFGYAKMAIVPVLLISVDVDKSIAYWIHIDDALFSKYRDSITEIQKTVLIHFPHENYIDGKDLNYLTKWKQIYEDKRGKIENFDRIERENALLKEFSNPILGKESPHIKEIHRFLDDLNYFLDTQFPIVKKVFFKNAWKVGIAYFEYSNDRLSYSLFPIPSDKNDVQIKIIDEPLKRKLSKEHYDTTGHYRENPIKRRSRDYALEIIESRISRILQYHLLNHKNEFLAREFIFAFIDQFYVQLGLKIKNEYTVEEIDMAFFRFLPHWTAEAIQHLMQGKGKNKVGPSNPIFRKLFIDPDLINCLIMPNEQQIIIERVLNRLANNNPTPIIPLGNEKLPFGTFFELFTFLKSLGIVSIQRIYSPKDYGRLRTRSNWMWNVYSPEQIKENLSIFFANLNNVYTSLVYQNFFEIKDNLPIFGKANRIVAVYSVEEDYDMQHFPSLHCYFLFDESLGRKIVFELYNKTEVPDIPSMQEIKSDQDFLINGRKYPIIALSQEILEFIFKDLPMTDYCYDLLQRNLKNYFHNRKEERKSLG